MAVPTAIPRTPKRILITAFLFFALGTRPQAGRWPTVWKEPKESDDKVRRRKPEKGSE